MALTAEQPRGEELYMYWASIASLPQLSPTVLGMVLAVEPPEKAGAAPFTFEAGQVRTAGQCRELPLSHVSESKVLSVATLPFSPFLIIVTPLLPSTPPLYMTDRRHPCPSP
jgi:hypothetical protein